MTGRPSEETAPVTVGVGRRVAVGGGLKKQEPEDDQSFQSVQDTLDPDEKQGISVGSHARCRP